MHTQIALTWLLFIPIAILNGVVRQMLYRPIVGDLIAHYISTLILSVSFIAFSYVMLHRVVRTASPQTLLQIGFVWVVLTVLFEFGFGHYVDHLPWEKLLADYNILKGRVWGLFLMTELITPYIITRIIR